MGKGTKGKKKMITAAEAKKRAQNSKEQVTKFLEVLGEEIEKQADQGLFEYEYQGGKRFDPTETVKLQAKTWETIDVPEFWKLVEAALKTYPYNYSVKIEKTAPFVPRFLGQMDDNPDPEVRLVMKIKW
jgi:hypothetical protein